MCLGIDVPGESAELLVGLFFLFQRFIEKGDVLRFAEFLRERAHRPVTRHFIGLDALRSPDESRV